MKHALLAILTAAALFESGAATAHIVPPEQYHPAAEGYRTITFLVNLNPVPWDLVSSESQKIASAYPAYAVERGTAYEEAVDELLTAVETEARISSPTAAMRVQTARGIFEYSTKALAELIVLHLDAAEKSVTDFRTAGEAFDVSRQLWEAFAYEVRHTDPEAFRELGYAWLEASSALGSEGILGVGGSPADTEVFASAAEHIRDYVASNFGADFAAPKSGWLVARPVASETHDANAVIPAKLPPGSNMNKQLPRPRQVLNFAVRGGDESEVETA